MHSIVCHFLLLSIIVTQTFCKYCPSISSSDNLTAVCRHEDEIVSCEHGVVQGTKATLQCKYKYRMSFNGDNHLRMKITCSANGTWNTNPASYHCTLAECGVPPEPRVRTYNPWGKEIRAPDIPWMVFIYFARLGGQKTFICGGALVNPDLVIVAGRYHYYMSIRDAMPDSDGFLVLDTHIGAGWTDFSKYKTEYPERLVNQYGVRKWHFSNNIIALRLETPFSSEGYVRPLCMDWNSKLDMPRIGDLAMGFTAPVIAIPIQYDTRVVADEECQLLRPEDESLITHNDFCIKNPNISEDARTFYSADSYAVKRHGLWYLAGVRHYSVSGRRSWVATKIGSHIDWIKQFGTQL